MNEQRTNGGIIFKNDRKQNDKAPDYRGKINVDGVEKEISLWVKEGAKGKFFSVQISEPYVKPDQPAADNTPPPDDDLPF